MTVVFYLFERMQRVSGEIVIKGRAEILAKPQPRGYPSEKAGGQNLVLNILHDGERVKYQDVTYYKDYKVYHVMVGDRLGYVIFDDYIQQDTVDK